MQSSVGRMSSGLATPPGRRSRFGFRQCGRRQQWPGTCRQCHRGQPTRSRRRQRRDSACHGRDQSGAGLHLRVRGFLGGATPMRMIRRQTNLCRPHAGNEANPGEWHASARSVVLRAGPAQRRRRRRIEPSNGLANAETPSKRSVAVRDLLIHPPLGQRSGATAGRRRPRATSAVRPSPWPRRPARRGRRWSAAGRPRSPRRDPRPGPRSPGGSTARARPRSCSHR